MIIEIEIKLDIGKYNYDLWDGRTACTPSRNGTYSRPKTGTIAVRCSKLHIT